MIMSDGLQLVASRSELLEDGTFYSFEVNTASEIRATVYRDPAWESGPWKRYLSIADALHDYAAWIGHTELAYEAFELEDRLENCEHEVLTATSATLVTRGFSDYWIEECVTCGVDIEVEAK
jgi:hypothetical protein